MPTFIWRLIPLLLASATLLHAGSADDAIALAKTTQENWGDPDAHTTVVNHCVDAYQERRQLNEPYGDLDSELLYWANNSAIASNDHAQALALSTQMVEAEETRHGRDADATTLATARILLSECLVSTQGDCIRAEQLARQALKTLIEAGPDYNTLQVIARINVGYALEGQKERLAARAVYLEALEFAKTHENVEPYRIIRCYESLINIARFYGDAERVKELRIEAAELASERFHATSPVRLSMLLEHCRVLPPKEQISYSHAILEELSEAPDPSDPHIIKFTGCFWDRTYSAYFILGDLPNAILSAQKTLDWIYKSEKPESPVIPRRHAELAKLLLKDQQYDRGLAHYEKAWELRKRFLGESHAETLETLRLLNQLRESLGPTAQPKS